MFRILHAGIIVGMLTAAAPAVAASLISNGDFEGGDLAGWTCLVSGDSSCDADTGSLFARTGDYYMELFENVGTGSVSQQVATTAGVSYEFSFWSVFAQLSGANVLGYSLDGGVTQNVAGTLGYSNTTDTFVARGAMADITFFFETDSGTGIFAIDDVTLTAGSTVPVSEVPLPASAPLLLAALGGLWLRRARAA